MKKIFKVLIAFVVIALLAVGAYFIFRKKDNNRVVLNNIQTLTYEIKKEKVNIVDELSSVATNMLNIINTNNLDVGSTKSDLELYLSLTEKYNIVETEILLNGSFVDNTNYLNDYLSNSTNSLNNLKNIYNDSYNYLLNTYYKIVNTDFNIETMKTYIINFNNVFKNALPEYNKFFYNTGIAYSHSLKNMMQKNNSYKLQVECLVTLVNNYYKNVELRLAYQNLINTKINAINNTSATNYFDNKEQFDNLINQTLSLNISTICEKIANGQIDDYITNLPTEADRILARNYVDLVVRGA